jgi:hypothetical protein
MGICLLPWRGRQGVASSHLALGLASCHLGLWPVAIIFAHRHRPACISSPVIASESKEQSLAGGGGVLQADGH